MATILVTGIKSFIGSHLLPYLYSKGHTIYGTCRGPELPKQDILRTFCKEIYYGDLTQSNLLKGLAFEPERIISLAAATQRPGISIAKMVDSNVTSIKNLIEFAGNSKAKQFIHFSTVSIYGEVSTPTLDQHYVGNKLDMYGATKKISEHLLANSTFKGEILALRLPAVVGKGAKSHWLANVLKKALADEEIVFDNPESLFNNVVHVSDLCRFIDQLLRGQGSGFHGFPLASKEPMLISSIVDRIIELLNSKSILTARVIQRPTFTIDDTFARTNFSYQSMTTMEAISEYTLSEAQCL